MHANMEGERGVLIYHQKAWTIFLAVQYQNILIFPLSFQSLQRTLHGDIAKVLFGRKLDKPLDLFYVGI